MYPTCTQHVPNMYLNSKPDFEQKKTKKKVQPDEQSHPSILQVQVFSTNNVVQHIQSCSNDIGVVPQLIVDC